MLLTSYQIQEWFPSSEWQIHLIGKGIMGQNGSKHFFQISTKRLAVVFLRKGQFHQHTSFKGTSRNLSDFLAIILYDTFLVSCSKHSPCKVIYLKDTNSFKAAAGQQPKDDMIWEKRKADLLNWQVAESIIRFVHMVAWRFHTYLLQRIKIRILSLKYLLAPF